MMTNNSPISYFQTIESLRVSPNRNWNARHDISLWEDRLLICSCLIGEQITSALAMWECGDLPSKDISDFIKTTYGPHIEGFLKVANEILEKEHHADFLEMAYRALEDYSITIRTGDKRLGLVLILLTLLVIYLTEYWATAPANRTRSIAFPSSPIFARYSFIQRCIFHSASINDWLRKKEFLSKLDPTRICVELNSI